MSDNGNRGSGGRGGRSVGGFGGRVGGRGGRGGRGRGRNSQNQQQTCNFFLRGSCNKGDHCQFLHEHTSAPDLELFASLSGHEGIITGVQLVDTQLFTASKDGTIREWDSSNGSCTSAVQVGGEADCLLIEGNFLIAGLKMANGQGMVKVWNMQTGQVQELAGHLGEVSDK
eukprot:240901-Prorocentrum_minimum.AAC.3